MLLDPKITYVQEFLSALNPTGPRKAASGPWPKERSIYPDNVNVAKKKHQLYWLAQIKALLKVKSLSIFIYYLNFITYMFCQST